MCVNTQVLTESSVWLLAYIYGPNLTREPSSVTTNNMSGDVGFQEVLHVKYTM